MSKIDNLIKPTKQKVLLENPLSILENKNVTEVLRLHYANNYSQLGLGEDFVEKLFTILKENKTNPQKATKLLNLFFTTEKNYLEAPIKRDPTRVFYKILKPHLINYQTFADFGCGKLALLKTLADEENDPRLMFIGIDGDSKPQIDNLEKRILYKKQEKGNDDSGIPLNDGTVDILNIQFVLHHLRDENIIKNILLEAKRVLKNNGRLIIWEESFSEKIENKVLISGANKYLDKVGLKLSESVTKEFNLLSETEKFKFIYLNDWIINYKNQEFMPWTFQYKTMEEWQSIIEDCGFKTIENNFLGVLKEGREKQGATIFMVFEK